MSVCDITKNYNKTKTSKKIYIKKDNKIDAVNNIDELNIDDCGLTLQEIKKKYNEYNAIIDRLKKKLQSSEYNSNILSDIDKCEIRTKTKTKSNKGIYCPYMSKVRGNTQNWH